MTRSGSLSPKNNGRGSKISNVEHLVRLAKARGFRGGAEGAMVQKYVPAALRRLVSGRCERHLGW